jgi:ligand-binding SRPBCC domain-containing protein
VVVRFELRIRSSKPAAELFDLARNVDAHVASMSSSRERAVGGVTSGLLALGDEVTWRGIHFGLPLTMTSRITRMSVPASFVDEQVRGPFRRFRHEHSFADQDDGGSLMIDRIEFEAPLGILGVAVERLILGRYLRRIIEERNVELAGPARPPRPDGSPA